jgi:predicted ATP-dependent endonuclease of OLD family
MKIVQFTLENFKSFKDSNNRINRASDINFIYGENNSGKSNILKFLKLIFSLKRNSNEIEVEGEVLKQSSLEYFFEGIIESEPYIYHKNLRNNAVKFEFSIHLSHKEIEDAQFDFYDHLFEEYIKGAHDPILLKLQGQIKSLDSRSTSEIELTSVELNSKEVYSKTAAGEQYFKSGASKMNLLNNKSSFQRFLSYLNSITLYIDNDRFFKKEKLNDSNELNSQNFKNWLYKFSVDEFRHDEYLKLLEFIKKNKIDSLKSLSNLELSYSIDNKNNLELILNNGSERLPIDSFGTGVSQIFYILCKIYQSNSRIILIEELELNLSPKTQRELFKIIRSMIEDGIIDQVFFTSHSSYFNFRNDFSIYEVQIDENGISNVARQTNSVRRGFFISTKLD